MNKIKSIIITLLLINIYACKDDGIDKTLQVKNDLLQMEKEVKLYALENSLYTSRLAYEIASTKGTLTKKTIKEMHKLIDTYRSEYVDDLFKMKLYNEHNVNVFLQRQIIESNGFKKARYTFDKKYQLDVNDKSKYYAGLPVNIQIFRHKELIPLWDCGTKKHKLYSAELSKLGSIEYGVDLVREERGYRVLMNNDQHKVVVVKHCEQDENVIGETTNEQGEK